MLHTSQPLLLPEVHHHTCRDENAHRPHCGITVRRAEFGHEVEIHTIDTDEERERHEDGRDDREDFHHFVHAVTGKGKILIDHDCEHVTERFDVVHELDGVVVRIAEVEVSFLLDEGVV